MRVKQLFIILLCVLLTGCWDQHLMKNAILVQVLTYDLSEKDEFLLGISIPIIEGGSGGSELSVTSETFSATGFTPRDSRKKIAREISGVLDTSKNKLILFGDRMATNDIYPTLDVIWRDSRNSLGATLAIVDGKALEILEIEPKHKPNVSEYFHDALTSAETNTIIPPETIQTLASEILDPGEDVVLPYLKANSKKSAIVVGLALMDDRKYVGNLSPQDSTLLLLMNNKKGKFARFTKKVNEKEKYDYNNYLSFNVEKNKRDFKVEVNEGQVMVSLNLKMMINVDEYPKGNVPEEIDRLNKVLTEELTKDANDLIATLQEKNCDVFGIGRRLMAFYPDTWEKLDQKEYFKDITFNTKVDVTIVSHGIVM
ncbi:Ger(x)C family spore germination protein [Litchfieldia salsa]|uniref:Germination protein, Ger(X)C family n=1 Tax=Litchfieldia salsa TaxID=930152 RepID=A0A1H0PFW2_9BACI|nr:Ger(x)C family spore germination protein [Litchfieldia salsa]SDP03947.1 germination protein, Ger(x)C family [Litchfieldia salsa]